MHVSVFELFKVGLGPSSSHAVGPMIAGKRFADELVETGARPAVASLTCELFGSLALTGVGHGTPGSLLAGLEGDEPRTVDPDKPRGLMEEVAARGALALSGGAPVPFDPEADLLWHRRKNLPAHPNGLRITARGAAGEDLLIREYYSIGGGFVVRADEVGAPPAADPVPVPHPFDSGAELLTLCEATDLPVSGVLRANELALRTESELDAGLDELWGVMKACVAAGCETPGILPGALKVPRRASALYQKLNAAAGAKPESAGGAGLGEPLGVGRQRGERRRRPGRHRPHQRGRRYHPRRPALLHEIRAGGRRGGRAKLPADRRRGGEPV